MACSTISTGGTITLTAGDLGSYCHTSWQNTLNAFVSATSAEIATGALFAANSSAPATNMLWLKQDEGDGCNPLGWYFYDSAAWVAVPVPAESLPSGVVAAGTKGSDSMNAVVTVDTYGRVTGLTEIAPTAETTDGHAKAWCQIGNGTTADPVPIQGGTSYNIASCERTSIGEVVVTTTADLFSNVCIALVSHPGFGAAGGTVTGTDDFTGSSALRVTSSVAETSGQAVISLPRMNYDGQESDDGDENWDNDKADANKLNVVFFGN